MAGQRYSRGANATGEGLRLTRARDSATFSTLVFRACRYSRLMGAMAWWPPMIGRTPATVINLGRLRHCWPGSRSRRSPHRCAHPGDASPAEILDHVHHSRLRSSSLVVPAICEPVSGYLEPRAPKLPTTTPRPISSERRACVAPGPPCRVTRLAVAAAPPTNRQIVLLRSTHV